METDEEGFKQLVADALDQIPESLGNLMDNVAVFVEDWPTPDQLAGRRGTLLGLYQGVDLQRRSSYGGAMPDRITIFRGPISALAHTEAQLVQAGDQDCYPRGGPPLRHIGRAPGGTWMGLKAQAGPEDRTCRCAGLRPER